MSALQNQDATGEDVGHEDRDHEGAHHEGWGADVLQVAPEIVEVRRRRGLAAGVGVVATGVAIAYLQRSIDSGSVLDWLITAVLAGLACYWLRAFVDSRLPLLVADARGVRLRLGRSWSGLRWSAVHHIEHEPHRSWWRDGRLVIVPHNPDLVLSELDAAAARQTRIAERLWGSPLALPLGISTRVVGAEGDLTAALESFARHADVVVVEIDRKAENELPADQVDATEPSKPEVPATEGEHIEPPIVDPTPEPTRAIDLARRVDLAAAGSHEDERPEELTGRELRVPGRVTLVEQASRVTPIAVPGEPIEPLVVDEHPAEPAEDPVIGPELAAARTRLGLSVDALAERTRIRPHVIEAMEVDDFEPCGGDFYAKGHVRTLARVLGLAPEPLVALYEERYAHAPINPRRVFEADLASAGSGSMRTSRRGPQWSGLVAVVMAIILAWSIARLLMDGPPELRTPPSLGTSTSQSASTAKVAVSIGTGNEGARVVVRNGAGTVVFRGNLAANTTKDLGKVAGPRLTVTSPSDLVRPTINGKELDPIGDAGQRSYATTTKG